MSLEASRDESFSHVVTAAIRRRVMADECSSTASGIQKVGKGIWGQFCQCPYKLIRSGLTLVLPWHLQAITAPY
jgi:hypothetical protein